MPQFLELKDKFGNNLYFGNGGDVRFAASPLISDFRQQLKDVRQLELRSDDVIVVGFPKSGEFVFILVVLLCLACWLAGCLSLCLSQNLSFLATKRGLMIHHHKPVCLVKKKLDYCIQGQGHSKGSKCQ